MLLNTPSLFFPKQIYRLSHTHRQTHTHTHTPGRKSSPTIIAVYLFSHRKNTVLTSFHFYYLFQRSKRKPSSNNLLGVRTGRNIRNCINQFLISGVRKLKSRVMTQSLTQSWNHHTKDGIHIAHLPSQSAFHYSKRPLCYRKYIEITEKGTKRRPQALPFLYPEANAGRWWGTQKPGMLQSMGESDMTWRLNNNSMFVGRERTSEVHSTSLINWAEERLRKKSDFNIQLWDVPSMWPCEAFTGSQFFRKEVWIIRWSVFCSDKHLINSWIELNSMAYRWQLCCNTVPVPELVKRNLK